MIKPTQFSILIGMVIFVLLGCSEQELKPDLKLNSNPSFEEIILQDDPHLQNILNGYKNSLTYQGRSHSSLNEVDYDLAYKKTDSISGVSRYAFPICDGNSYVLQNFILTEYPEGLLKGHLYRYEVDSAWLNGLEAFPGWDAYTGAFSIVDMEGNEIVRNLISNGSSLGDESEIQGRSMGTICSSVTYEITVSTP